MSIMRPFRHVTLKQLIWPWAGSTFMALLGFLFYRIDEELWVVVYGFTPLVAVPLVLCLIHIWPRRPWLIVLLMLALCYGAQWGFILADLRPLLVITNGAASAMLTGLVSAKLGNCLDPKPWFYLLLAASGSIAIGLLLLLGRRDADWVTASVWVWQILVGSILVIAASQSPATRDFNIGVLQT